MQLFFSKSNEIDNLDMIKFLVSHGANVTAKDSVGMTGNTFACNHSYTNTLCQAILVGYDNGKQGQK